MIPFEMSWMPLPKKIGMPYGESGGTLLRDEFHYEPIFT
jgi:hypothetical protein